MFNVGDLVKVRDIKEIPPIPSYDPREMGNYYYAISARTLNKMSRSSNPFRIARVVEPAPVFDNAHEPVAYILGMENTDIREDDLVDGWSKLYFLENMLEPVAAEEISPPPVDSLFSFLMGTKEDV